MFRCPGKCLKTVGLEILSHRYMQTDMYTRLATLAAKKEDYDRALQLLTRAQSLEPFHAGSELEVISLVSVTLEHSGVY